MKVLTTLFILILFLTPSYSQKVKDFFYADKEGKELPVLLRGNLHNHIILLYVQGGPGETAIDFARSDYPRWKQTLEKDVAIAYYDQRGLNRTASKIDSSSISFEQYGKDIISIAQHLKDRYKSKIYLLGHSAGGRFIYHCLDDHPGRTDLVAGAIIANTPLTNDYSPERYTYYRPLYLENLAKEFIDNGQDVEKWQEAYDWMKKVDSIHTPGISYQWNRYVDMAFHPAKRKISLGMIFKVLFSRPYHPFKYLYRKDNKRVSDLLWMAGENEKPITEMNFSYPILIISGRYDDIAPPEEMEVLHSHFKSSNLVILPGAAHESYLDQAERFNEAVLNFLKRDYEKEE